MKRPFASVGIPQASVDPVHRSRFLVAKMLVRGVDVCWLWLGSKTKQGYGRFRLHRSATTAQRVAYALFHGDLEPGLTIDHLCGNPSCVNPAHLEAVPHRVNVLRSNGVSAQHARRTHCQRCSSELVWYIGPNSKQRYCPECKRRVGRESVRRRRAAQKASAA